MKLIFLSKVENFFSPKVANNYTKVANFWPKNVTFGQKNVKFGRVNASILCESYFNLQLPEKQF